ncbi:PREDICTED: DDRGK domain-containing protein 1 [Nicrophorus vespilloides]|uniref:DDRGK domain-containing protein 1 n=1 Tax=Nicrophorus vespilloides TaxID=110193 RepID=A0ABM1NIM7_NICVS|nr:PREDICTED: DDRGK domain-containing protein 1 [Nicrophorus vespilloides]
MDLSVLIAISALLLLILMAVNLFIKLIPVEDAEPENRPRPRPNRVVGDAPRRAQMVRNRGARLRANAQQQHESDEEVQENEEEGPDFSDAKIGAKKRAKMEAKAEKKAMREAEEHVRADKKKRDQQAEDERKKLEDKEKAEELKREEEEKKMREEKERREHEEYLKMKAAFSVEEEGYEEGEAGNEENLLQEFVKYIRDQKVVVIEDIAAKFKLKTQAVIDRIKDLQEDNILTGVIDDRGKFIYVSQTEMEAVAKFIKQRGRVSIQELAENSNQLINLTPVVN